jgi:glycosyltransferase involved in cell wall biosynthesis
MFLDEMMDEKQIEEHLPLLYQNAIALLYPSVMEGFGIPVLEAMSSSTAVITSNQSSLKEAGGDAAYLVDPHDVTALSNAMNELMNHESIRQTCIAAGHKHLAHFSLQNTTHALMKVYQKVLTT